MMFALILLSLLVTVKGQDCYSGSVSQQLTEANPSPGYWYLNLSSISSCSGELKEYEVIYYSGSNSGYHFVHVAMWEPGDSNTSFTMVAESMETFQVELNDKRKKRSLPSVSTGISQSLYIRKGTIIGVYFENGNYPLPVLGSISSGDHYLCKISGNKDDSLLNCTSDSIHTNLVLHVRAKIGVIECDPLPNIQHGRVSYINGGDTQYGAIAQYTCDEGYELGQSGNEYRECQDDETWSGSQPSCQIISYAIATNTENIQQSAQPSSLLSTKTVSSPQPSSTTIITRNFSSASIGPTLPLSLSSAVTTSAGNIQQPSKLSPLLSATSAMTTSTGNVQRSSQLLSFLSAKSSRLTPSDSTSVSTSQSLVSERVNVKGNSDGILAGAIVSAVFLLLLFAMLATIVVLIWLKRSKRKQAQESILGHDSDSQSGLINVIYQSDAVPINAAEPGIHLKSVLYEDNALQTERSLDIYESIAHHKGSIKSVNPDDEQGFEPQITSLTNPLYDGKFF